MGNMCIYYIFNVVITIKAELIPGIEFFVIEPIVVMVKGFFSMVFLCVLCAFA
jgi:hypothetical protein